MLDEDTLRLWNASARAGTPPPLPDVANLMFDLRVPWWWADAIFPVLDRIGDGKRKHLVAREVSRGHGKTAASHLFTIYAASFIIPHLPQARDTNKDILVIGRDVTHARDLLEDIHKAIARYAPWLKHEDHTEDESWEATFNRGMKGGRVWNRSQMSLTNGVTIRAFSITQSVRRFHCYLAVIDDLVTEENLNDSAHYVEVIESAILKAIEPGGVTFLEGTPQGDGDVYDLIRQESKWDYLQLPGYDVDGTLGYKSRNEKAITEGYASPSDFNSPGDWHCLWPWRMDAEAHEYERGDTRDSNLRYEREILLRRVTMSDALVAPEDITAAKDPTLHYIPTRIDGELYVGGADPSGLAKSDAAIIVGTRDDQGALVPRHIRTMKALGKARGDDAELRVAEMFNEVSMSFGNPLIKVEDNQYQGIIKPLSEKFLNPHVIFSRVTLGAYKHTEAGWLAIRTLFRNRLIRLPWGPTPHEEKQIEAGILDENDIEARRLTSQLIEQLRSVRVVDGKLETPRNKKDDLVSALFLLYKASESLPGGSLMSSSPIKASVNPAADRKRPRGAEFRNATPANSTLARVAAASRLGRRRF